MNTRNRSPSSRGSASMSAITRTGMCWAYSVAASTSSRPFSLMAAIRSRHVSRALGSQLSIAFGEKNSSRNFRAIAWNGGSEVIGGA